jgi:hypothetical protein
MSDETEMNEPRSADGHRPGPEIRRPAQTGPQRQPASPGPGRTVFELDGSCPSTTGASGRRRREHGHLRAEITALIGPSGCGKSPAALLQPDERPDPQRPGRGQRSSTTGSTSTAPTSTRSRSDGGSGWCSRSPTPSPSRSTTTSPSGPRINGFKGDMDDLVERRCARPRCGTRSRTSSTSRLALSGRSAAAAVHRPGHRHEPRRDPDGRAVLGARPDRHARIEELMLELKRSTRSSSSPTTCSRPPGSRIRPPSSPSTSTRRVRRTVRLVEFST